MSSTLRNALVWEKDISVSPIPVIRAAANAPRILIVGAGVTGLVTAWILLDKGYHVTILSAELANDDRRITSQIAGALWEFPPAVCGSHTNETSLKHSKHWCMVAYHIWDAIATDVGVSSGVRMRKACFFFTKPIEKDAQQYEKMLEIKHSGVKGFRRSPNIIVEHDVDPSYGAVDAYEHLAPVIDTDVAMPWLMGLVRAKGARVRNGTVLTDLLHIEDGILDLHQASLLINASGLASSKLAADPTVYPLRGALLHLQNDGSSFPQIASALSISADASDDGSIVFLVPRNDNVLVVGGIAQPNIYDTELTPDDSIIKRMRKRCNEFLPGLKNAKLVEEYPLAQGLRPARRDNVRVEREMRKKPDGVRSKIVHNYGHGGSGWSLSFGCAADVSQLVGKILTEDARRIDGPQRQVRARL